MLTNHLMATPRLDNLFISTFISLKSIDFMPDSSMNQVTAIIRSPLQMTTDTDAPRGHRGEIVKVLVPLSCANATHVSFVLATLINKQSVVEIIQTLFLERML